MNSKFSSQNTLNSAQRCFFLRIFSPVRRHKIKITPVEDVNVSIFPQLHTFFLKLTSKTPPDSSKIVIFSKLAIGRCLCRLLPLSASLVCFSLGRDVMNGIWVNVMIRLLASAVINASLWQRSDTAQRGGASGCK